MSEINDGQFDYDDWVQDALRGVLRRALETLAASQAPAEHHFYVNFRTTDPDVGVPGFLRAQYPEEITVVLQHQFEDLCVDESGFEVTLSFSGQRHRLVVPFSAVTSFADPSVNFGLQMGPQTMDVLDVDTGNDSRPFQETAGPQGMGEKVREISESTSGRNIQTGSETGEDAGEDGSQDSNDRDGGTPDGGADVISIEAFRNK